MRPNAKGLDSREVDMKKIMHSKAPDEQLVAEDIVYIPPSKGRAAAEKLLKLRNTPGRKSEPVVKEMLSVP